MRIECTRCKELAIEDSFVVFHIPIFAEGNSVRKLALCPTCVRGFREWLESSDGRQAG